MTTTATGLVVLAVYRPDPDLLARQIHSLRAQTLDSWTCAVGIDGPDDAAVALLSRLVLGDRRFIIREYPENVGVYRHFERLLGNIPDGIDWVALADQDDVWHQSKLARLAEALAEPGVTATMCQARLVDESGLFLGVTNRRAAGLHDLLLRNQVTGSLAMFAVDVVRRSRPFPPATGEAIHDHWLGMCAAALGEVRLIDESLQDYVQHPGNVLGEEQATSVRESWASAMDRGGVTSHLNYLACERWGWRVSLAYGLESNGLGGSVDHDRFLTSVAEGRFSVSVVKTIVGSWLRGCLRARGLASSLLGALWFSVSFRASVPRALCPCGHQSDRGMECRCESS